MKILFVAPLESPECTAWLILKAMKNLGLEVEPFSYREITKTESQESMNFQLREKVIHLEWKDLVFVIKGDGIWPETLIAISARKILWWFDFDSFILPENLIKFSRNFHYVFLMCYPWVASLRDLGINAFFMPQATDPSVYHPVKPEAKYECDVAFIGSYKAGRDVILRELKNFRLLVFGNGWNRKPVYLEEFNKVCNSAKVILNITSSDDWPIYSRTFSQRIYMTMAAGGYLVTDNIPELPFKWVGVYENIPRLKGIIEWAIENEDIRKVVCKKARVEILRNHTYYHRIKEIFRCLRLSPSVLKSTRA